MPARHRPMRCVAVSGFHVFPQIGQELLTGHFAFPVGLAQIILPAVETVEDRCNRRRFTGLDVFGRRVQRLAGHRLAARQDQWQVGASETHRPGGITVAG